MGGSFSKKINHYNSLVITVLMIAISVSLVVFVYRRMYRLTENNSWIRLTTVAEDIGSNFSKNLQYQSLFLGEYAQIIKNNKVDTPEKLQDFYKSFMLSSGVYEIYILLPDNRVIGENGQILYKESNSMFNNVIKGGEHFSHLRRSIYDSSAFELHHYYPVEIDGTEVCVLFCVIDLDFLSNEGVTTIYDGNADYIIFNSRTHEMYVNTYTKLVGNLPTFFARLYPDKNKIDAFVAACENRETAFLELGNSNQKMSFFSIPISSDDFSLCVFGKRDVIFSDLNTFESTSSKIIFIMSLSYIVYLIYMIKSSRDKFNVHLMEERVKKAESEARYKTLFLSEMSHDIRTPMNAIVGYINLALLNLSDTVKIRHYLSKGLLASNHLLDLINEVLDVSRIESGKINITEVECDLTKLFKEIENIMTVQTRSRKQNFSIDASELKNQFVMCDKLHLSQILINILGNSVKYTQNGGEISLSVLENSVLQNK